MPEKEEGEIMEKEIKTIYPYKECEQYVNLLQENITRMANNSANCKNWLVAIIAGVLAVVFTKDGGDYLEEILCLLKWITGLFFFLDCLYLGIERDFIKAERVFIRRCKAKNIDEDDLKLLLLSFSDSIEKLEESPDVCSNKMRKLWKQLKNAFFAMFSWSTTPFYGTMLVVLCYLDNM